MVYYYISGNVKMLKNMIIDYRAAKEISPHEYMKCYIEKCPENTDDTKLSWITESFLGIQKHFLFLTQIADNLPEQLSEEERYYFIIIFHAIIFHISPQEMQLLYKCLFNLSKPLLSTFTKFLGNNEVLTYISHVAQSHYDADFITLKLIHPLFTWQPYISEMGHNYAEYVKKIESRKLKPVTVPIPPNVLSRKSKKAPALLEKTSLPMTPPNSLHYKSSRKMLTKAVIDKRLKNLHEKNKQKATHLLNDVKNYDFHYAQIKSDRYHKTLSNIKDETEKSNNKTLSKPTKYIPNTSLPPIKETTGTLKRLNKRIQITEQNEIDWLEDLVKGCRNAAKIEEMEEFNRQETERERLYDIEKKHLLGQISYEEALIARKKLQEHNKKKYEEFLKDKEKWCNQMEAWKQKQMAKNLASIENISLIELNIINAKSEILEKNKNNAQKIKQDTEKLVADFLKTKQEELDRKVAMIKEIRILSMIAKKAKVPKIIDLTESSGLGLLCEMSIAELQERMSAMKIEIKEEIERKKQKVKELNDAEKNNLEQVKTSIKTYMSERATSNRGKKNLNVIAEISPCKEIKDLKKILDEKRRLRIKLSNLEL